MAEWGDSRSLRRSDRNKTLRLVGDNEMNARNRAGGRLPYDQDALLDDMDKFIHEMGGQPVIRTFDTGANRDSDGDKLDYEGFLSPAVLARFAEYMHKNRQMADGSLRDSDNWQKGIPLDVYMKSAWRHFMEVWETHRELKASELVPARVQLEMHQEALCALMFNIMGYLHEILKDTTNTGEGQ